MKRNFQLLIIALLLLFMQSCQKGEGNFDATGTFEAKEIIISSESTGRILAFAKEEGQLIEQGELIAQVDTSDLLLQVEKIKASIKSIGLKTNSSDAQVEVLLEQKTAASAQQRVIKSQIEVAEKERQRIEALVASEAATAKQLDDINGQLKIFKSNLTAAETQLNVIDAQIKATQKAVSTQNRAIKSEKGPLEKQIDILNAQVRKASIQSPIKATLIAKYAYPGELITMGRPIAKLANLSQMTLRAYITTEQLEQIKLNQEVTVNVDQDDAYKSYQGRIEWISAEAEFTPKTIQTKDERANLVYAIKVNVPNDGYLKIGMYGEVALPKKSDSDE